MVIDYILDRKDGYGYDVKEFYDACMAYEEFDIARALDSGTEKDVKKALCNYIIDNDYPKSICKYINSENWLEGFEESKKSARKSMKESINGDCYIYYDDDDGKRNVFCDYVKGITDTRDWFYLNEYIIDAIHIFKNEKQAQKFIDEHLKYFADQDNVVIAEYPQTVSGFFESKESSRKSIKESADDIITVKEFCFWGHSGNIVEIWTIDGVLCDSFEVRNVGKSEYKNYEIHGWDCAKNTVIIYIKK